MVGYDEKNLPITKNVLAKTKREVEEKLNALKKTVQKPVVKTAADMPFGEFIDYWYRNFCELSIAATTRLKYENDIYKHIIPGIGKLPLAALKKSDLEKFYAEQMKSGILTATVSAIKSCRARSYVRCTPASNVRLIRL